MSHALGVALSLPAMAFLLIAAAQRGTATLVGCTVYGITLVMMYCASTAYHGFAHGNPRVKLLLRRVDHAAIFLLICGTYTPLALTVLRNTLGYFLLGAVWALSGIGQLLVITRRKPGRYGPVFLYLVMGWTLALALPELSRTLGPKAITLFLLGGVAYTLGVPFYVWRSLRYHHAVWHGFVLLGSALHFVAMIAFVVPPSR